MLFETTMATGGHALPFVKAVAEGAPAGRKRHEDDFVYAIDIHQARGRDIQPLSSTSREPRSRALTAIPSRCRRAPLDGGARPAAFRWRNSHRGGPADPGRAARSLEAQPARSLQAQPAAQPQARRRPRSRSSVPTPRLLEDKIADGKRIRSSHRRETPASEVSPTRRSIICEPARTAGTFAEEALGRNEIVANMDAKSLEKGAIELYRKAKADFEEGGVEHPLPRARHAAVDARRGRQARSYRAPLIMLPVRLERQSARFKALSHRP